MLSRERAAIFFLSGTLALTNGACSSIQSLSGSDESPKPIATSTPPSTVTNPPVIPAPLATPMSQPTLTPKEAYEQGLDAAYSAATIAQSAQSPSDWQLVSSRWQEAIELLQKVPSSSSLHAIAQSKITQYQRNQRIAQQRITRPRPSPSPEAVIVTSPQTAVQPLEPSPNQSPSPLPAPTTQSNTTNNAQVFRTPIKRRVRGTPVIEVTFNGTQTFEMVVDTGASGTVLTPAMAQSLNIFPEGEVKANTASAKGVTFRTGRVESIAVDGAVARNMQVAIGGPELEIGLLGQDFYSKYDVAIKQNVVEFHSR